MTGISSFCGSTAFCVKSSVCQTKKLSVFVVILVGWNANVLDTERVCKLVVKNEFFTKCTKLLMIW